MPPTVLLIRHAQALHNISNDWTLRDPPLSPLGIQQCASLQSSLASKSIGQEIDLIIASAMRRTLQTAVLGLSFLINDEKRVPVLPSALWQENSDQPCDTGSGLGVIEREFPGLDFSKVDGMFPGKNNAYAYSRIAVLQRGQLCLEELYSREEKVVAVVSHSGFLRTAICGRQFANADWRVFDFEERKQECDRYVLKEREETEKQGGGMGRSEIGVFGIREGEFPFDEQEESEALGEAVEEKPAS